MSRILLCVLLVCLTLVVTVACWPATVFPELELAAQPSTNGSSLTPETKALSRKVNTSLTGTMVLLTAATYWLLMRCTPALSHGIALHPKFLEYNIAALLSKTWLEKYMGPSTERFPERVKRLRWVLFRKTITAVRSRSPPIGRRVEVYGIQGYSEVPAESPSEPIQPRTKRTVKIRTFSPVVRSLVQVAVWNSISFWLVIVMVTNTIVYNGFATNNLTQDGTLRLFLVCIYALANLACQRYVSAQLYRNLACTVFQTCWTLICNNFILLNGDTYSLNRESDGYYLDDLQEGTSKEVWATLDLELFGKTQRSYTYQVLFEGKDDLGSLYTEVDSDGETHKRYWKRWEDNDKRRESHLKAHPADKTESNFDKFTKPWRDAELKAYEKSAGSTLEKMLANTASLLGICLATALAPWTSIDKSDATAAQLGSYALLLTISTGLFAIMNIFNQMSNATVSARTLLKLQEQMIEVAAMNKSEPERGSNSRPAIMFSEGIENQFDVTRKALWRLASLGHKLTFILLGPGLMFIPQLHRDCTNDAVIYFKVRDEDFTLTTFFTKFLVLLLVSWSIFLLGQSTETRKRP